MFSPPLFELEDQDGVLIVVPLGSASTLGGEDVQRELAELFGRIERSRLRHAVIDFSRLNYFNSSMLGILHAIWKRVRTAQGRMAICQLSDVCREILKITRFDTVWPIYATRSDALAALRDPA
jgi:anti-anti-sigma factor